MESSAENSSERHSSLTNAADAPRCRLLSLACGVDQSELLSANGHCVVANPASDSACLDLNILQEGRMFLGNRNA